MSSSDKVPFYRFLKLTQAIWKTIKPLKNKKKQAINGITYGIKTARYRDETQRLPLRAFANSHNCKLIKNIKR